MNEENQNNLNELSIGKIIGGILTAIIDAQNHALDNVVEFIQRISPTGDVEKDKGKYIEVSYDRASVDDPQNLEKVTMKVPLLSILPVPYMSIKKTEIDFDYRIHSVSVKNRQCARSVDRTSNMDRSNCEFYGSISPSSRLRSNNKTAIGAQINIKMLIEEDYLGEGFNKIVQEGELAIDKKVERKV